MEESSWTTVQSKKKTNKNGKQSGDVVTNHQDTKQGHRKGKKSNKEPVFCCQEDEGFSLIQTKNTLQLLASELENSEYCNNLFEMITSFLGNATSCKFIGLGFGSLVSSQLSIVQLAVYLSIRNKLISRMLQVASEVFDPTFKHLDTALLSDMGLSVSTSNTSGMLSGEGTKLICFMPHCPYQLYNNILWSNWDNLGDVAIIGNSFGSYETRRFFINRNIDSKTECILSLLPLVKETSLDIKSINISGIERVLRSEDTVLIYEDHFTKSLNDTSFHMFPIENLLSNNGIRIISEMRANKFDMETATKQDLEIVRP